MTARGVMSAVVPQQKKLVIDEAFLIEGQAEDELPVSSLRARCYAGCGACGPSAMARLARR